MTDDPRRVSAPTCEVISVGRVHALAGPARRVVGARLFWPKASDDVATGLAAQALLRSSHPERLESAGVTLSAGTGTLASYVDFRGPRDAVRKALRDFTDSLPDVTISFHAYEAARAAAIHQAEQRARQPKSQAADHFRRVRAGLPPPEGEPGSVTREELPDLGTRSRYLIIVGDAVESYVDTPLGTVEGAGAQVSLNPDPPAQSEVRGAGSGSGSGSQAYVLWGAAAAITGAADLVALELAMHVLGGWSGSRWHALFREQLGYTYGTTAQTYCVGPTVAFAHVGMAVATDALAKTESLLLDQARAFLDHGPGATELTSAAVQLLRTEAHYYDSVRNLMSRFASFLQSGLPPGFAAERIAALRAVEPESFAARMRELLRHRTLVTVTA